MGRIGFLGYALLWAVLGLGAASAADRPVPSKPTGFPVSVMATIDVQRILQESLASKDVQRQLEAQRARFQAEVAGEETELRKGEEELAKIRDNATHEIYAGRERKLRERFMAVERHVQARRKVLDQAYTDSMDAVRKAVLAIVADLARHHGANIVVAKSEVLWSDQQIDLTDEVLAKLNKTLTRLPVKLTEPAFNEDASKSLKP